MAKEILVDAMHTPALPGIVDRNSWCPCGPGARRGINRIFGRPTKEHAASRAQEPVFLHRMLYLFHEAKKTAP